MKFLLIRMIRCTKSHLFTAAVLVVLTVSRLTSALTTSEKNVLTSSGSVTVTTSGSYYEISCDGLPDHDTENVNPNTPTAQNYVFTVPQNPTEADEPSCLPMGPIAVTVNGVPFFSPFTAEGENAVEGDYEETFDSCDGHPAEGGQYHYHKNPGCIDEAGDNQAFVGVAFDGYPIYSMFKSDGSKYTSDDLDECHGITVGGSYRYVLTEDYPYILGCYRGEVPADVQESQQMPGCTIAGAPRPLVALPLMLLLGVASLFG